LGYLLFICVYLGSRMLEYVNPDLMVSAFVLLALGLMLRISAGRGNIWTAAALGLVLGVGYLAKAAMFPFGAVVLMTLFAVIWMRRQKMVMGGVALLIFLAISVPFIAALSWNNHHFTTGDSGKLNVAWNVNGVNGSSYDYRLWLGEPGSTTHRDHPVRKTLNWPEVYEFATPIGGTYPVWEDPTYWWAGVDTKLHPAREAVTFVHSVGKIAIYLIKDIGILTAVVMMIFLLSDRVGDSWRQLIKLWPILVPTIAVFMMYAIIVWLTRYTTGVMLAGFAALIGSLSISDGDRQMKVLRASGYTLGLMALVLALQSMFQNYHDVGYWAKQVEVAERLHGLGVERGDHLAIMGDGFDEEVWARLNGVEIVAEVPRTLATGDSTTAFWSSDSEVEQTVLNALKAAGAKAVVAQTPAGKLPEGWVPLGNSGHVVLFLQ
jgi:4-amino-4-deoxy-L-arabinose transferase-like glycosyltransferase